MDNHRLINSLGASNRRKLLDTFHHRTINDAVKYYTDIKKKKYSDEEKMVAFKLMQEEYNDVIINLRKDKNRYSNQS